MISRVDFWEALRCLIFAIDEPTSEVVNSEAVIHAYIEELESANERLTVIDWKLKDGDSAEQAARDAWRASIIAIDSAEPLRQDETFEQWWESWKEGRK